MHEARFPETSPSDPGAGHRESPSRPELQHPDPALGSVPGRGSRKRGSTAKAALALGSATLALLFLECAVRILDVPPRPLAPLPLSIYRLSANPVIAYEYCPSHERPAGAGPAESWSINADGFRDREHALVKPAGTYRIVALGDSTTAGNGIADPAERFTERLEGLLTGPGAAARCEILNMGVGGYHTLQEVETLRTKGLKYDLDLVLVTLCLNDFHLGSDGGVYHELRARNPFAVDPGRSVYRRLLRCSRLAFVLHHRLGLELSGSEWERRYAAENLGGSSPVRVGLERLSALQREHGFEALVVILPFFERPFRSYRAHDEHRRVIEAARGLPGIMVVDLLERFAALSDDAARFSEDGLHLSRRGHEDMARILADVLQERAAFADAREGG